jgi:hypothetical protein
MFAALGLTACGTTATSDAPLVSESGSISVDDGAFLGSPQPLETSCADLATLLDAAGRTGEERWDVLTIRIYSLSLRAASESDRTMFAELSTSAKELIGGTSDRTSWASAKADVSNRCATVGVPLP